MIIFIFGIMALSAIADTTKGVLTPLFIEDFHVSNTSIGIMLAVCSLGYIIFTYFGGALCERIGQRKVFFLTIISLLTIYASKNFMGLIIGMFIMNIGISFISISINTLIPIIFASFQAVIMNITHCCFGIGATLASFISGTIIASGSSWRNIYIGIAIAFIFVLIYFLFIDIPVVKRTDEVKKFNNRDVFKDKYVYLYGMALGTYVFAEMSTTNWLTNFLQQSYNFSSAKSSMYLTAFLFLFTIGRLVGGFIAEKKGYFKSVLISLFVAVLFFTVALIIGDGALILVCISGLFFAITFPTVVLTIGKVFKENSSYVTGVVITFSSFVNMIMNLIIGRLNDIIGTTSAFYIIPMSLMTSIIFITIIYKKKKYVLAEVGKKNE